MNPPERRPSYLGDTPKIADQEHEEIPSAEELVLSTHLWSDPDRYEAVGEITANIDMRPYNITYHYKPIPLIKNPSFQYFIDDHQRSLNEQFAQVGNDTGKDGTQKPYKGKNKGGRDMRTLHIENKKLQEKRSERLKLLETKAIDIRDALIERLPLVKVRFLHMLTGGKIHLYRDDEGKLQDSRDPIYLTLQWGVGKTIIQKELGIIPEEIQKTTEGYNKYFSNGAYQKAVREGMQEATKLFREETKKIQVEEQNPDIQALKKQFDDLYTEIALFHGSADVGIPLYIAPQNMSPKERQTLTEQAQKEDAYSRQSTTYTPNRGVKDRYIDQQNEYGVSGTHTWYKLLRIDTNTEVIDFSNTEQFTTTLSTKQLKNKLELQRMEEEDEQRRKPKPTMTQPEKQEEIKQQPLTPEQREILQQSLAKTYALYRILYNIPGDSPECTKFKNDLPTKVFYTEIQTRFDQEKSTPTDITRLNEYTKKMQELANRQKITKEFPNLWDRSQAKLTEWEQIPSILKHHEDVSVIVDGGAISLADLTTKISNVFLSQPWETSVSTVIQKELDDILENL